MDYSGLKNSAINLIRNSGRSVSFVYKTQGTYDPGTDAIINQTVTTKAAKMVILDYKRDEMNKDMVKIGDRLALLAVDNLTRAPKTGDTVIDSGETYAIVAFEEIKPGDTTLLYKLQLRRGG